MAAELPEVGMVALCIAVGCAEVLKPLLDFLEGVPARGPVLDAAAAAAVLTIPMAYLVGVMLLYLHVPPAPALAPPASLWRFAVLVRSLFLFVALVVVFLAGFAAGGR